MVVGGNTNMSAPGDSEHEFSAATSQDKMRSLYLGEEIPLLTWMWFENEEVLDGP